MAGRRQKQLFGTLEYSNAKDTKKDHCYSTNSNTKDKTELFFKSKLVR